MDFAAKLQRLRETDFLSNLPEETLERLCRENREITLGTGEVLFEEGTVGRSFFVVLEGKVVVYKGDNDFAVGGPGNYFGEMAIIESKVRSASVRAIQPTTLLEITDEQFQVHVATSPRALLAMMRTISNRSRHDLAALDSDFRQLRRYAEEIERTNRELDDIRRQLIESNRQLETLSSMDTLTGLANRRRFDDALQREWNRAARDGLPLSLILCDIDFFKAYNDTYGHPAGDECLVRVARELSSAFSRAADLAARYGGEEFVLILANTVEERAASLAERLRSGIESLQIPHGGSRVGPYLTISLGVATTVPRPKAPPSELISLADQALYAAKQQGRNRVCIEHPERLRAGEAG